MYIATRQDRLSVLPNAMGHVDILHGCSYHIMSYYPFDICCTMCNMQYQINYSAAQNSLPTTINPTGLFKYTDLMKCRTTETSV